LENHGYEVLIQNSRGRGDAFRLAFLHAEALSLDGLVFISTDGNEDQSDLPKFLEAQQQHLENLRKQIDSDTENGK
jgi:DNA-binding LacI/PurR family transcriptional regulator